MYHLDAVLQEAFPLREGDAEVHIGEHRVSGEPDPATGTYPLVATVWVQWDDGERREQTVYFCDFAGPTPTDPEIIAVRDGLARMERTVLDRLARWPRPRVTPQNLVTAGPIRSRLRAL